MIKKKVINPFLGLWMIPKNMVPGVITPPQVPLNTLLYRVHTTISHSTGKYFGWSFAHRVFKNIKYLTFVTLQSEDFQLLFNVF